MSGRDVEGRRSRAPRRLLGMVTLPVALALLASAGASVGTGVMSAKAAAATTAAAQDWPMYLHDASRSAASGETILNTSNVNTLHKKWTFATGASIVDSPAIVNGIAYVGSWDGYEYALCANTCSVGGVSYTGGQVIWKTNLGTTTDPNCTYPVTAGITSAAAVVNGVVYVGGGDSNWYALNATTGAVLWSVPTGDNSPAGGHYNWSSPAIYNGSAYVGIASNCDNPLVQGQLLRVDLTSHVVAAVAKFVPDGQLGGGVWTSPTIDPATNSVFVSTGTINQYTQKMAQAVVAMDATTLAVKSYWQLPFEVETYDSDWGTTPILTSTLPSGHRALAAANKNGVLYTFDSTNLASGPIWQQRIAQGGECPTCGDGTISSGAYAASATIGTYTGPVLFFAAGANVVNGVGYQGSVSAFNPATGAVLWTHHTNAAVGGSLAYVNGMVFDNQINTAEVLDASTGNALFDYAIKGAIYAAPSISGGQLYVSDTDNSLYVFSIPSTPPQPPPADANCPAGFTCQDIGSPRVAGSETTDSSGNTVVTGAGPGVRSSPDQMRLVTKPQTGDFQVGVNDLSETGGCNNGTGTPACTNAAGQSQPYWAPQMGIMIRESADPGSPYYAALQDPTYPAENEGVANLIIYYRQYWNGPAQELDQEYPAGFPRKFIVQRRGDVFQTLVSGNGTSYFLVPGTTKTVVMPTTLMAGTMVSSGMSSVAATGTYNSLGFGPPTNNYGYLAPQHPCPAPWTCFNVNNPNPPGDQILSSGSWSVSGAGFGIASGSSTFYGHEDSFYYVNQSLAGDQTMSARFTGFTGTSPPANAEAGLMARASTDPRAAYYGIFFYPGTKGAIVQWRVHPNINSRAAFISLPSLTAPRYVQISRYTDTRFTPSVTYYSAATSTDGINWTPVNGSTAAIDMGGGQSGPTLMGMAVDAGGAANVQVPAGFDSVKIGATTSPPPGICENGWTCADVGNSHVAGNQTYVQPTWTMQASGDLWDVYDQFRWAWQSFPGDGTVTARVVSQSGGGAWQKSGVMIRAGATDPQAPYYGAFATPSNGVVVQWRSAEAATTNQVQLTGVTTPVYLMVLRYTDTAHNNTVYYYAQYSTDNTHWTLIPNSVVPLNLPGALSAGLAATSYSPSLATSTFDNVNFLSSAPAPPGICPAAWSCADINGALPPGTQTHNADGSWSFTSGGSDMWDVADQFHYMWQTLASDGSVTARVTAESGGGAWAKGGVMFRLTTDPGSPNYSVLVTPSNGVVVQWRAQANGSTSQIAVGGAAPLYVRVIRWTDTSGSPAVTYYEALTSADGTTWSAVPGSLITLPSLSGTLLAGVATDSWNNGTGATWSMGGLSVATSVPPPSGFCPQGWTCEDVGVPAPAGSQTEGASTAAWTVQGGGSDIWNASDQFHFVARTLPGDGTLTTRVTAQDNTSAWAKAGIMLRGSTNDPDPQAPYYGVFVTPGNGVEVQYRPSESAQTTGISASATAPLPQWLRIARWTDTTGASPVPYYTAYTSTDGSTWTPVPGSTVALSALTGTLLSGLAVTSHSVGTLSSAGFDSLAMTSAEVSPPGVCPANRSCVDVGGPAPAGTQTLSGTTWSVSGGGSDIWGVADQFRFVGAATSGDGTVSAQVPSVPSTSAWAKAGVMMRANLTDAGAAYYAILVTPANNTVVQWRTAASLSTGQIAVPQAAPLSVRVSRWTDAGNGITYYYASTSSDGSTWNAVPGSAVAMTLPNGYYSGVAVTSHNTAVLNTTTFNSVAFGTASTQPPGICPSGYTCADIGNATPAGTQTLSSGTWSVQGGGSDIWNTADQFRLVSQGLSGDGTILARVASIDTTSSPSPWAKAGLMLRMTGAADSAYYGIFLTPANGLTVQYRSAPGGITQQLFQVAAAAPVSLKIIRTGTSVTALYSTNGGSTWLAAGSPVALPMGAALAGVAVTSHDPNRLWTAAFDAVTL